MFDLQNKTVLVTGANSGIGEATASYLHKHILVVDGETTIDSNPERDDV